MFGTQVGGQRDALCLTQADDLFEAFSDIRVFRFDCLSKPQIAQRVFMGAIDLGSCRQCGKPLQ